MKAYLRSVRIAPKKANLIAKMVRGMPVTEALDLLERTNKKGAEILIGVIKSAAANARQNDGQNPSELIVKTIVVNKAITYHRGIPMARGRMRRIRKFLSHISVTLGFPEQEEDKKIDPPKVKEAQPPVANKKPQTSSQTKKSPVKRSNPTAKTQKKPSDESKDSENPVI